MVGTRFLLSVLLGNSARRKTAAARGVNTKAADSVPARRRPPARRVTSGDGLRPDQMLPAVEGGGEGRVLGGAERRGLLRRVQEGDRVQLRAPLGLGLDPDALARERVVLGEGDLVVPLLEGVLRDEVEVPRRLRVEVDAGARVRRAVVE